MANDLNPCPFCDGMAKLVECELTYQYWVECGQCGAGTKLYDTLPQDAIDAWNRRTNGRTNGWHLLPEAEPDPKTFVLVQNKRNQMYVAYVGRACVFPTEVFVHVYGVPEWFGDVVAWQPLPKPYIREDDEDDKTL